MPRCDRRKFISLAGRAAAFTAIPMAQAAVRRPNIVFIMADDLGHADLSCYGSRHIATPNIDRLAREGLRFTQAYSNSAVCSATRAALITGRYQYRLRVGLEEPLRDGAAIGLPPEHPTLPSLLRTAGYRTALVGKWHLGALPDFGPLKSGYETFYGFRGGAVDYYTHESTSKTKDLWDGDTKKDEAGYLTELLGHRAEQIVDKFARRTEPFFLSLHFSAPHWPWEPPGDDAESRRIVGTRLLHYDGGSLAVYRQMVESMDQQVGRILAALERRGVARDTIVVFTSDNGGERFSDSWPFSGRKTELLEGGVRVPALLRWPRRLRAGGTSDQVNVSMDWMPTLLAAAGARPDPAYPLDGIDLLPLVGSGKAQPRRLFWRFKSNAQRSMRDGDFKWLRIGPNDFLFNLADDPMERANLKARQPEVYQRLVREWEAWNAGMLPESPDTAPVLQSPADAPDRY
jgi:arylsulfatase A-like enzyme